MTKTQVQAYAARSATSALAPFGTKQDLRYEDANSFFRAFHAGEGTSTGEWRTVHGARYPERLEPMTGR